MKNIRINIRWYFDIISEIGNDITLTISMSMGKSNRKDLVHVVAGKRWDIDDAIQRISE